MSLEAALNFTHEQNARFLEELKDICAIPSVSTDSIYTGEVQRTANWLADHLRRIGLKKVEIYPTAGHPIVYAESLSTNKSAKTVLVYGHYDVQPAEEETIINWHSEPFKPTLRGDDLYARGTTDMKGQILAAINAVEAIIQTGNLPVNIKFMLEGEEEIGSPHLEEFIQEHTDLLACDVFLNPDTGMISAQLPTISYGLRGLAFFELTIFGPKKDLHSGSFGGVVHNPALALCKILSSLHDEQNRVTLPGFYDKVRYLTEGDRDEAAKLPKDEKFYLEQTGVPALWGEDGYTPEERIGSRPTLEINGLYSGFIGKGSKTVLPAYAMAKISTRLVPDQKPDEIYHQMMRYLQEHVPQTVTWELNYKGGSPASLIERDSPGIRAISKAFDSVWGKAPVFKREGGSVPVVLFAQKYLRADVVNTGFSLPEDGMHGPDEKINLPTWYKGTDVFIHFLYNIDAS